MTEIEIGKAKRARRAYSFDDIAIVPSRRTRDPEEVSVAWQIDAYRFELPILAAPMDSVMSPETAIALGKYGGLGVLNLEGLWTRYEAPEPLLAEVSELQGIEATRRLQEIYAEPIKPELITQRLREIRDAGVTVAGSLSPQRTKLYAKTVVDAGVDMFVIRGTTVSAEHVSSQAEPLNLKEFIYELDVPVIVGGCATYQAALHLMRTGAAGVLVGFGGGAAHTTRTVLGVAVPMASAVADVAAARRDYMDESGGRYVHVIADGSIGKSGDIAKAVACGADAVMVGSPFARATDAPGRGFHWGGEAHHPSLPRGQRVEIGTVGTLEEILFGPSRVADGTMNIVGALRRAMATTGYTELKEFQRIEVVVSEGPVILTVAAAQAEAVAGDLAANDRTAAGLVREAADRGARVVVLPEAYLTGYDLDVFAGPLPSLVDLPLDALRDAARDTGAVVVASSALAAEGVATLSSVVVHPDGAVDVPYDKQHLDGDEARYFTPGDHGASIRVDGLELGLSICYDGCFPEHARAAAEDGAVAYLSSSAYFAGAEHRRDLYYAARAVENGMYVVFAGLTGRCGSRDFSGGSAVYDPEGRPLVRLGTEPGVAVADLDTDVVDATRARHTMLADHRDTLGPRDVIRIEG